MSAAAAVRDQLLATGVQPPSALTVAITSSCNLACTHCLVDAGTSPAEGHVPAAAIARLAGELAALGASSIVLTGGEPLRHPAWREIVLACRDAGLASVTLQTNGAMLGDAEVEALCLLAFDGLAFQVSLDGASPATHDAVRGRGTFARTVAGLERLARAGLGGRVTVAFTEMRHNLDELPALLELVERLGLRRLACGTLVEAGRAAEDDAALAPPTPDGYRALLARYHLDARFRALCDGYGDVSAVAWWRHRDQAGSECCNFADHPYLTAEGLLYPCALYRDDAVAAGDAFDRPLGEVLRQVAPRWAALQALKTRRHRNLPECQGCPGLLHCGGGCMGRARAASGEPWSVEDRCSLRKAVYGWTDIHAR